MFTPNLVVFSHLRWSFVHQRPQHLLGRLAGKWRVTFIEEPIHTEGLAYIEVIEKGEHLNVLVPHTPIRAMGFHDDQIAVLSPMIQEWLSQQGIDQHIAWLYTPMALPVAQALDPLCLVYDCMDELSAFKDAPQQLCQRENSLMQQAALVLSGGLSLYEARRTLNPNVHCIPSSVDALHFSSARLDLTCDAAEKVQSLHGAAGGTKMGYFGVIDERMDLSLVAHIADEHPEWQLILVGPVVKVDPATLPHRPNIHWLGMQPYERLPYFVADWDVCLMPFALNDATRFISPTKTLEYMAGGKPVVSTAVTDVVAMYSGVVEIAYTPAAFVRACERLLDSSETDQEVLRAEMASLVAAGSWDRSVGKIDNLLWAAREAALDTRTIEHPARVRRTRQPAAVSMSRV